MTLAVVREKLHDLIDHADEEKVRAIFSMFQEEGSSGYVYDDETLNMLEERRTEYIRSGAKGYTVEESMELLKKAFPKSDL